jgi:uncharacterized protein YjbI with pentapeptide repeats
MDPAGCRSGCAVRICGANLSGALLFKARLHGTHLENADLSDAELTGADLSGAYLSSARLNRAGMGEACLRGANLFLADLESCTLSRADLTGADLRKAHLQHARLREADLSEADLTGADLRWTDLSHGRVGHATFRNADLRHARLRALRRFDKANWVGVDLRDVNFAGAYRLRRFIIDQNYLYEFRQRGRWAEVLYFLWWVTSDCGRSVLRWCFWVILTTWFYAILFALVGLHYGAYQTWLSPLYFSVVTLTSLGYGDVVPASTGAQVLVMLEVITGYLMLGGLMSIFSNKLARRGE